MLYRDVLFTSCTDFTSLEDLYKILVRRFTEAWDEERNPSKDQRRCVQDKYGFLLYFPTITHKYLLFSILGILRYLLTNRHLYLDSQILVQMRNLCMASNITGGKADDIIQLINDRVRPKIHLVPLIVGSTLTYCKYS